LQTGQVKRVGVLPFWDKIIFHYTSASPTELGHNSVK
jgi:hypothetical protein